MTEQTNCPCGDNDGLWCSLPDCPFPRPNRRQLAKASTRQKVLASAEHLFEAGTYESATIREIAAGARMSTGAVFANFADKAAVWSAVYDGPPPSALIADEIARALGQLSDWTWTLHFSRTDFVVTLLGPDWTPDASEGQEFTARGDSPAGALRAARLAALQAMAGVQASHAVRRADDQAA